MVTAINHITQRHCIFSELWILDVWENARKLHVTEVLLTNYSVNDYLENL